MRKSKSSSTAVPEAATDQVETVDEQGNVPRRRITTPQAAYQIYMDRLDELSELFYHRALVQGMIDGNKPLKKNILEKWGQDWRTNFNTRETEGIIDKRAEAFWELLMAQECLVDTKVPYEIRAQIPETVDVSEIVSRHFTTLMKNWKSLHFHTIRRIKQMLTHGLGPTYWADPWTWKSKTAKASNFITMKDEDCDIEELGMFMMRDKIKVPEAWKKILLGDKAKKMGWRLPAIRKVLIKLYKNEEWSEIEKNSALHWEEVQRMYRNKVSEECDKAEFRDIPVVHFCVKEWSTGKITMFTILDDPDFHEFLFYRENAYESMSHAVVGFFYDIGTGEIESIKSLGYRIYPYGTVSNDFFCSAIDAAKAAGSIVLQPEGELDVDKLRNIRFGGLFTILASGLKVSQAQFSPNLNGMLGVRAVHQQINNSNVGHFQPRLEEINSPEKTLGQVQMEHAEEVKFEQNKAEWFYVQQDAFYAETYRRLTVPSYYSFVDGYREREEFIAACEREGVPRDILHRLTVCASRAVGMGSPSARLQLTADAWNKMGALSETGRHYVKRQYFGARWGYDKVDRIIARETEGKLRTRDTVEAHLENNDFREGHSVPVVPEQMHTIHAEEHITFLGTYVQLFEKQRSDQIDFGMIEEAVRALKTTLPHLGLHFQYLQQDPTRQGEYKAYVAASKDLIKAFRPILMVFSDHQKRKEEMAQRQQEMMNPESALRDPRFMLDLQRMRRQLALEQMQQENMNAMRMSKTQEQLRIAAQESASRIRIKEAEAVGKLRLQEQVD